MTCNKTFVASEIKILFYREVNVSEEINCCGNEAVLLFNLSSQ